MGLCEQLLNERAEEEERRGGPLSMMRGMDSKALNRRWRAVRRSIRRGTLPICGGLPTPEPGNRQPRRSPSLPQHHEEVPERVR